MDGNNPPDGARNQTKPYLTIPNQTEPYQTVVGDIPPSAAAPAAEFNPFRLFEQEGFGTLTPIIVEQINDLVNDFGERWVNEAMKAARISGKRNLRYVAGILERYKSSGIDEPWTVKPTQQGRGKNGQFQKKPQIEIVQEGNSDVSFDKVYSGLVSAFKLTHNRLPTNAECAEIRRKAEEAMNLSLAN
nr:DnaD domain protein [Paenibacillus sp. MMS18-CY102]